MARRRGRPRLRTRNPKVRCFIDGCRILAERFLDVPMHPRQWYCGQHFQEQATTARAPHERPGNRRRKMMSNDPSVYNTKQRVRFRCVVWNETHGIIKDEQGCEYKSWPSAWALSAARWLRATGSRGFARTGRPSKTSCLKAEIQIKMCFDPGHRMSREKNEVAAYVKHLANTGNLRVFLGPDRNSPWVVEGIIIRDGIHWSVVLVPAGSRLDHDRPSMDSAGQSPDAHANPDPLRGTPDTGAQRWPTTQRKIQSPENNSKTAHAAERSIT